MRAALRHRLLAASVCAVWLAAVEPVHAGWRATIIPATGVSAIQQAGDDAFVLAGTTWFRFDPAARRLVAGTPPTLRPAPAGALPDARVTTGRDVIRETWLSDPTTRYRHGVLGDAIEAGSLSILRQDGSKAVLRLGADAVFEDIAPRVAQIDGRERIVLVKSYLDRGAAIAVIDPVSASIVAESPPIGHANAWRNPAGIADYNGDGTTDIAAVRQPHVVGSLELWSIIDGRLKKTAEVSDVCNHVIGSRVLGLSATADFDGDGMPDLAIPSSDRRSLRLIAFAPSVRDIARVALPARVVTDLALVRSQGRPSIFAGLENGQAVLIHMGP